MLEPTKVNSFLDALMDNSSSAGTMWHTKENPELSSPADGFPQFKAWVKFDYKKNADGKPGREVIVKFKGDHL